MSYCLLSMSKAMCVLLFICINVAFLRALLLQRVSTDCRWLSTGKLNNQLQKQKYGIPVSWSASQILGIGLGPVLTPFPHYIYAKEVHL